MVTQASRETLLSKCSGREQHKGSICCSGSIVEPDWPDACQESCRFGEKNPKSLNPDLLDEK